MALSKKDKHGVMLMTAVAFVLIAFVVAKVLMGSGLKPDKDGCVGPVFGNSVIVIDHSDTVSEQTRAEIVARAMAFIKDKTKTNERVSVFTVSQLSKQSLIPVFSRCKPPEDGNRAVANVKDIEKRFKRDFLQPVEAVISQAPEISSESPVAQALIDISLSQYLNGEHNSLLIFSDMVEHTNKYSLYKCTSPSDSVKNFRLSRKGAQERPKFKNANVQVNVIPRTDISKATLICGEKVWEWFFGDNEGPKAGFEKNYLPGA